MKIIQLVTKRQFRGAEVFASQLSKDLLSLNHTVLWVGLYANHNNPLSVSGAKSIDLIEKKPFFFSIQILLRLIKLISIEKPDIIQANGSDTLKYLAIASFFIPNIPISYRNISIISEWINSPLKKMFYKFLFSRVDFVTSVGVFALNDFCRTFDYDSNKIAVIRRGININNNTELDVHIELKQKFDILDNDILLVHVGNFSPEKNHQFLIDVMVKIKIINKNVKLLCLGEGVLFSEIQNKIVQNQLEDTVYLYGFCKYPKEVIAKARILLLCSKVEGVPGVILEGYTKKVPTVAVAVGGVEEVVINEKSGLILNDFNVNNFVSKVMLLVNNEQLAKKMGIYGYEIVKNEYSPKANALLFVNLYERLISAKSK
jgi:glycosyltransferase involved in cell wall biosynthesis